MKSQSILNKTKQVQSSEQQLKTKARALQQKIIQTKSHKQSQLETLIKTAQIDHYQTNFTTFKSQLEQQTKSQSYSLQLIKQFKLNEIIEFQDIVKAAISYLQTSREETCLMEDRLQQGFKTAVQFLEMEAERERKDVQGELRGDMRRKVDQFKDSVYIQ